LRLLVPKEDLIRWVENAKLVQIKGLGIENFRLLEKLGVLSVTGLASENPDVLYERIVQFRWMKPNVRKAKLRIWIREAQKAVRSSE
jgi:hypothetical protein